MAAPSIVQSKLSNNTTDTSTIATTFDTTPGVGRLIVVFAFADGVSGSEGLPTVADNQGNTYTSRTSDGYGNNYIWGRLYTAPATTSSGTFTVTTTASSGTQRLLTVILEVANWNSGAGIYEKLGHTWTTGAIGSDNSPLNFTATTNAEQLFLAAMASDTTKDRNIVASTGWTDAQTSAANPSFDHINCGVIWKSVTSTGTYDPEWDDTTAGGSTNYMTLGISLIGGTDGPAGSPDVTVAASGSAMTGGSGTKSPLFEIPL